MIIIFIGIYLIYRVCWYVKSKQFDLLNELLYVILFLYFSIMAQVTIFKYGRVLEWPRIETMNRINMIPLVETIRMLTNGWNTGYSYYQVIANVVLFMPLGFLLPLLFEDIRSWKKISIYGCLTSVIIEVTQIFTWMNVSDIDDVIFNTLGALLGYACYLIFTKLLYRFNLKNFVDKLMITSTSNLWKKSVIPFSLMITVSIVVSVYNYFDQTVSADLSDKELLLEIYGSDISTYVLGRKVGNRRFILQEDKDFLEVKVYEFDSFNRLSFPMSYGYDLISNEKTYEQDLFEEAWFVFGINEEASSVRMTYMDDSYEEVLPLGAYLVIYPNEVAFDLFNQNNKIEFLNELGEVIESSVLMY